jgi:transposase
LPGDVPAQLPLSACGFGLGNSHRGGRSLAAEFQAEIVAPCQRDGRPASQAAQDADPNETPVWARADQAGLDTGARSDGRLAYADRRELAEIRRETRRLREDVEVLKRGRDSLRHGDP